MAKAKSDKLTLKHIIGYGAGDCGGCFGLYMVAMFMSRFLQVNLGVNAALLATILLVWNVWDTVNDPLMGTIMDICFAKAKPGADKFRPWILASIPILAIGMIAFFTVPGMLSGFAMIASAFILKIVFEAGYTMMNIGMGSLLGNMAKNDSERATLASARGFGSTFGGAIGGMLIPLLLGKFGMGNDGYAKMAMIMAVPMAIVIFIGGRKEIKNRPEMLRLIHDCKEGRIDCIATQSRAYLAANTGEFCSLIRYLFDMATPIHIITEDEAYNINTIINEDQQKEELYRMAYSFTEMNPDEYRKWIEGVFLGIDKHVLQEGGHYGI